MGKFNSKVTINLTPELDKKLKAEKERIGGTSGQIVRRALTLYLEPSPAVPTLSSALSRITIMKGQLAQMNEATEKIEKDIIDAKKAKK
jgi:hypothetical protein